MGKFISIASIRMSRKFSNLLEPKTNRLQKNDLGKWSSIAICFAIKTYVKSRWYWLQMLLRVCTAKFVHMPIDKHKQCIYYYNQQLCAGLKCQLFISIKWCFIPNSMQAWHLLLTFILYIFSTLQLKLWLIIRPPGCAHSCKPWIPFLQIFQIDKRKFNKVSLKRVPSPVIEFWWSSVRRPVRPHLLPACK